ncbi:glycosyltransferase [Gordonia sp. VNK1]|uniref:glycosyltransferase n=1 Tax=Gordonia oleivorans TaxID=3156618 RepID=UPI0032B5C865
MSGVIVAEWVEKIGGSENVVDAFLEAFPGTDVYCTWNNAPERFPPTTTVTEGPLARNRLLRGRKGLSGPLLPWVWRRAELPDVDWVLVSSHMFAHHVKTPTPDTPKLTYVHSPARYIWVPDLDPRAKVVAPIIPPLRRIDKCRAAESSDMACNSRFVAARIADAWEREARVIYPPVDVHKASRYVDDASLTNDELRELSLLPADFVLGASRLVRYKALDDVITVGAASGVPVVIAGDGPDRERLETVAAQSGVPVTFLGSVSDPMLYALYRRTLCYVFPPIEDFGLMPVEAMATGAPVITNRIGGAAESVVAGVTGAHIGFDDPAEMRSAVDAVTGLAREDSCRRAEQFGRPRFLDEIRGWVDDITAGDALAGDPGVATSS